MSYAQKFGVRLEEAMSKIGIKPVIVHEMKKGQTLIWAASLIHGGSHPKEQGSSRLSSVVHYYFEGAEYFWSPIVSSPNKREIREMTPCLRNEALSPVFSCADLYIEERKQFYERKKRNKGRINENSVE